MKQSKKGRKHGMRIDVKIEYNLVWGDFGVEYHTLEGRMSVEHSSDEAIAMAMAAVVEREQNFLELFEDEHGWIQWLRVSSKLASESEKDYRTESLHLMNNLDIVKPILCSKPNR